MLRSEAGLYGSASVAVSALQDRQSPCRASARLSPHISGHPIFDGAPIGAPQAFSNTFQGVLDALNLILFNYKYGFTTVLKYF